MAKRRVTPPLEATVKMHRTALARMVELSSVLDSQVRACLQSDKCCPSRSFHDTSPWRHMAHALDAYRVDLDALIAPFVELRRRESRG